MNDIPSLLAMGEIHCDCRKTHRSDLQYYHKGSGALRHLPDTLRKISKAPYAYVCFDQNLYELFHEKVEAVLQQADIPYAVGVIPQRHPFPNEQSIDSLAEQKPADCNIIVGVGSGVINDCCRTLAFANKLPQVIVATAPSMDGYASSSSSLLLNGVKSTVYQRCPVGIIADTDLLKTAPQRMIWAGYGDMLAKYIALAEWRISHLVIGAYYCPFIAGLMRDAVGRIVEHAPALNELDNTAIESVMDGLVLSGMAMSYADDSRPASGLEHYFSHAWDMRNLAAGNAEELHGIQVGVGTLISMRILQKLRELPIDFAAAEDVATRLDNALWEKRLYDYFGDVAARLIQIAKEDGRNDSAKHKQRLRATQAHWKKICDIIAEELPDYGNIHRSMQDLGMPLLPTDIGQSVENSWTALQCTRDMRDKYLTSTLLWDLGLLYEESLWKNCLADC